MKKVGDSIKGIGGGFIAILIGIVLLWWNEGNNVKNIKTTNEISNNYIDVTSEIIDSKNEGKLIATNGRLTNEEELYDSVFDVKVKTPVLKRVVEIYEWKEESETDEDGDERYTYSKVWESTLIDSQSFNNSRYSNPTTMPYNTETYYSEKVNVGAFLLTREQLNNLSTNGVFNEYNSEKIEELNYKIYGNYITNSEDINNPQIGDIRISFVYNNSTEISVLAVQSGNTFKDYVSSSGKIINSVVEGIHSGEEMINIIKSQNNALKWILRLGGFLFIFAGIATILKPISAVTSVIPVLGYIVGSAVGLIAFVLGLSISLFVISIAWLIFRPLIGISLLIVTSILVYFLIKRGKNQNVPLERIKEENAE